MVSLKIAGVVFITAVYFVFPLDLIPDIFPLVGWLDDAFVIKWAYGTIKKLLAESQPPPAAELA
jgi:uncharacterized membrane protein YkvA (DUF1232 family)